MENLQHSYQIFLEVRINFLIIIYPNFPKSLLQTKLIQQDPTSVSHPLRHRSIIPQPLPIRNSNRIHPSRPPTIATIIKIK